MKIYLAGPMRGKRFNNFPAFDAAAKRLRDLGHQVISPADLDRANGYDAMKLPENTDWNTLPDSFNLDKCVERDVKALRSCEAIAILPDWQNSTGVKAEKALGEWLQKPVLDAETLKPLEQKDIRTFTTGATRSPDEERIDPEGFLSPIVLERYCQYMNKCRIQSNGEKRASDNWQRGIPFDAYIKGLWRHFLHLWTRHRGFPVNDPKAALGIEEDLCAIIFNAMGYLFEILKTKENKK
jgi:hypothetical protein